MSRILGAMGPSSGARRVAILLTCLDPDTAKAVLNGLPADQVEVVRTLAESLGDVTAQEQLDVLQRFLRGRPAGYSAGPGSVSASGTMPPSGDSTASISPDPTPAAHSGLDPTTAHENHQLVSVTDQMIAELVTNEHPQTIAVVLSKLPAPRAMEVVARLEPSIQAEVLHRFVEFNGLGPGCGELIEHELNKWIDEQLQAAAKRAELVARVGRFLEQAHGATRSKILASLHSADSALVRHLQPDQPGRETDS